MVDSATTTAGGDSSNIEVCYLDFCYSLYLYVCSTVATLSIDPSIYPCIPLTTYLPLRLVLQMQRGQHSQ